VNINCIQSSLKSHPLWVTLYIHQFYLYKDKGLIIKIQSRKRGSADQGYFKGLLFLNLKKNRLLGFIKIERDMYDEN